MEKVGNLVVFRSFGPPHFNLTIQPYHTGGGHVAIGYHLAKELSSKGHQVTILQDGDVDFSKSPFNAYSDLSANVVTKPFDATFSYPFKELEFDFIFDNNSKVSLKRGALTFSLRFASLRLAHRLAHRRIPPVPLNLHFLLLILSNNATPLWEAQEYTRNPQTSPSTPL